MFSRPIPPPFLRDPVPLLMLLAWLIAADTAPAQLRFDEPVEISNFVCGPNHVRAADLDGDGDLDVIAAERNGARVIWWENDGHGDFLNRHVWEGAVEFGVVGIDDYDGDSRPDIWLVRRFHEEPGIRPLFIATGRSDGDFNEPVPVLPDVGPDSELVVIDANADGRADLLHRKGVRLRLGDGTFTEPAAGGEAVPDGLSSYGLTSWTLGRFGGAGPAQLLCSGYGDRGGIIRFDIMDDGSFGPGEEVTRLPEGEEVVFVQQVALDPDAAADRLLVGTSRSAGKGRRLRFSLHEFDLDGRTEEVASVEAVADTYPCGAAIHPTTPGKIVFTWLGDLGRSCGRLGCITIAGDDLVLSESELEFPGIAFHPLLADVDGDGVEDLLMPLASVSGLNGPFFDQLVWHRGTESGGFEAAAREISEPAPLHSLVHAGDIDGDGDGDVVTTGGHGLPMDSSSQELVIWRNLGERWGRESVTGFHDGLRVIDASDRSGNGRMDFLLRLFDYDTIWQLDTIPQSATQKIVLLTQSADGTFDSVTLAEEVLESPSPDSRPFSDEFFAEVDWNGDGTSDLLFRRLAPDAWTVAIHCLPGLPDGGYGEKIDLSTGSYYNINLPFVHDMDHDGDPDVVEPIHWLENDGAGGVTATHQLPDGMRPLNFDVDGDGHDDLAGEWGWWLSRPEGQLEKVAPASGRLLKLVTYLDLDGDGDRDLLVSGNGYGQSELRSMLWAENRSGTHAVPTDLENPGDYQEISAPRWLSQGVPLRANLADMDGDGQLDLVVVWVGAGSRIEWYPIRLHEASPEFTTWMSVAGAAGHSAGPMADWDADGLTNFEEFAFGSDPLRPDPGHAGRPKLKFGTSGLELSFLQRSSGSVTYQVEQSDDLLEWRPLQSPVEITGTDGSYGRSRSVLPAINPKRFFRVTASDK